MPKPSRDPKLNVFPIEEVSNICKTNKIPLILDNTAAPYICKPIQHGANIVVYSTTKYIGGHGLSIGGLIMEMVEILTGNQLVKNFQ